MAALRSEPGSPLPCHPVASGWYGLVYRAGESHERLVYHRCDYRECCAHVCTALACKTPKGYPPKPGHVCILNHLPRGPDGVAWAGATHRSAITRSQKNQETLA